MQHGVCEWTPPTGSHDLDASPGCPLPIHLVPLISWLWVFQALSWALPSSLCTPFSCYLPHRIGLTPSPHLFPLSCYISAASPNCSASAPHQAMITCLRHPTWAVRCPQPPGYPLPVILHHQLKIDITKTKSTVLPTKLFLVTYSFIQGAHMSHLLWVSPC